MAVAVRRCWRLLLGGRLLGLVVDVAALGLVAVGPLAVVLLAVHVALLLVLALAAVAVAFRTTRVAVIVARVVRRES